MIDECTLDHASYANMQCSNLSPIQTYCTCAYPLQISGARLYGKPEASYEAPSKSDIKSHAKPTTSKPITIKPQKRLSTRLLSHPLGMDIPVIDAIRPNNAIQELEDRHRGPGSVRFSRYVEIYDNAHGLVIWSDYICAFEWHRPFRDRSGALSPTQQLDVVNLLESDPC